MPSDTEADLAPPVDEDEARPGLPSYIWIPCLVLVIAAILAVFGR